LLIRQYTAEEETMPGDPKERREHAKRCAELAKAATAPEARDQFLSLQMSWIRLAADLDNAKAFIDALDEMDFAPPAKAAE
jgi:ribosome-binding factor A